MTALMPRRPTSEKRQRSILKPVRLTPGELAQLEVAAERAGMTASAFIRHQSLGTAGPRSVRRPPVEVAALAQLLAQLGKCGGNINQIAKVGNATGTLPAGIPEALADFRATCGAILHILSKPDG